MYVERQKTKQINIETKLEISLIIIDQVMVTLVFTFMVSVRIPV